jgi:RNA polymerase sigma factor (sigma-70 family)
MGTKVHCPTEPVTDPESDPEVIARRTALFNKYITPFINMIFKLVVRYSNSPDNVEENYSEVLVNFYRYIETYDPSRPIRTWIHICVKRQVFACERQRQAHNNKDYDNDIEDYEEELFADDHISSNMLGVDNWRELYSADIVSVLDELKPRHRDALILQEAGYSLKEIAEIEYAKGSLKTPNIETIKSRLRLARQHLKNNITRDGKRIPRQADAEDVP